MGEWHFPKHYTEAAKSYQREERRLMIQHFEDQVLESLRRSARAVGYALAVHGSKARDYDLIAVPWRDDAVGADELIETICGATKEATGWGHLSSDKAHKPCGRVAVIIIATADVNIDLSVMPLSRDEVSHVG